MHCTVCSAETDKTSWGHLGQWVVDPKMFTSDFTVQRGTHEASRAADNHVPGVFGGNASLAN